MLKNTIYRVRTYFEMPPTDSPTLPEVWLAQMRIKSWPVASIAAGIGIYIPLLILTLTNTPIEVLDSSWLRYSLLYPIVTIYLFLLVPLFKRLYSEAVAAFLPLLPKTQFNDPFTLRRHQPDTRREWLAFGVGALAGWLIAPYEDFKNIWQTLYGMLGEGMTIGLLSWLVYRIAVGTKHLTGLHNQTHGLNIPRPGLFTPLSRWGVSILLAFVGGNLLSFVLAPQQNILAPKNLAFYIILNVLILVVFLRRSESALLLAQFRILRALALFLLVAMVGTLGYHYLEGWEPLDGLYMTVITMTTIGYGETRPLHQAGRIFTIVLSLVSVGIAGYAISAIAAFIFEGDFQRVIIGQKMNKQIAKLQDHIILCGAGYVGEQIAQEFYKTQTAFLLIGQSQEALEPILRLGDIPYLLGDPTKDETLHLAGIKRAAGLVANLNDDKDNAFVVLSARSLNVHLRIVARLNDEENAEKLRKVGADEIISPNVIGGLRIASVMLRPAVVSFLDEMMRGTEQTLRLEEKRLGESSSLAGKMLLEVDIGRRTGLLVVAIKSVTGAYLFNPQPQTVLNEGDTIIVIGTPEQLTNLKKLDAN